ncbi:MAG: complex I NDUFA9 subunit family protein [Limisphaerales bacterium]
MKILVTGGSGFVGRAIVERLLSRGDTVRVLARGTRPTQGGTVETVQGSILRPETLTAACQGVDAVLHLVGIISEVGDQTFERVHTEGTRNMLEAARSTGLRRFIHMSALGTRPNAVARYHRSKWEAEQAVRASGLDWTIFRPSLIYGPGDGFVGLFARMAQWSPVLPVIGTGQSRVQPVAVEDVAHCFAAAPRTPGSVARTFDLCGPRPYPFDQVIRMILEATGRHRGVVHLPLPIARLQAGFLEKVFPRVLDQAPPLNRDQIQMLQEDNVGDPGPASEVFGFTPRSFEEGLARLFPRG